MTTEFVLVFAGLFGACIGSFLNVVIWRLPRGESLSKEGSHCPKCGAKIRWHDNVPILGWLFLRGRCRACRAGISPRYPLVEALTAALFVLVALRHDPRQELAVAVVEALVLAALVAIAFIDHDERIIPSRIVMPGLVAGLAVAFLVEGWAPADFLPGIAKRHVAGLVRGLLGAATGAGTIFAIRVLGKAAWKKEVMGLGDVRLMGMVGAFTSPLDTVFVLFLGSLSGAVLGGLLVFARTRTFVSIPVAFGPPPGGARARREHVPTPMRANVAIVGPISRPLRRLLGKTLEPRPRVELRVPADRLAAAGAEQELSFAFPPAAVWRDGDEPVEAVARVRALASRAPRRPGDLALARYEVLSSASEAAEPGEDVVETYAMYRKAIPFGVFLALGAAIVVLYGDEVARFVLETWPRLVTGGRAA